MRKENTLQWKVFFFSLLFIFLGVNHSFANPCPAPILSGQKISVNTRFIDGKYIKGPEDNRRPFPNPQEGPGRLINVYLFRNNQQFALTWDDHARDGRFRAPIPEGSLQIGDVIKAQLSCDNDRSDFSEGVVVAPVIIIDVPQRNLRIPR